MTENQSSDIIENGPNIDGNVKEKKNFGMKYNGSGETRRIGVSTEIFGYNNN